MWLGLQFPALGLEVFECSDARPAVLLEQQRVVACNGPASAEGILCGSTLATARSICPHIHCFHRNPVRERARLQQLAEAMYRFSSEVSVADPDGVVLEVGRSRSLYPDPACLGRKAAAVAGSLGHQVSWRLADTAAAALILARSGERELETVPLGRIGLPDATLNMLASMGIRDLGGLLALPEPELGQRFGSDTVSRLQRLAGRRADPRMAIRLRPEFSRQRHLLDPVRDKDTLLHPIEDLLGELEVWLIGRGLEAERLCWRFATQQSLTGTTAGHCEMNVSFGRGRQRAGDFLPIIRLRLDRLELPEDILSVGLEARSLRRHSAVSEHLFGGLMHDPAEVERNRSRRSSRRRHDARHAERPHGFAAGPPGELVTLLDELRARLGEEACHGVSSVAEHVPERAWRRHHWREPRQHRRQRPAPADAARRPGLSRPCWLFDPPRPVEPAQLTLLRGPERIQTAWWRRGIRRDYYVARHHSGSHCWAFVDERGGWFLHGYFA